jgi:hypothetical protein
MDEGRRKERRASSRVRSTFSCVVREPSMVFLTTLLEVEPSQTYKV